MTLLEYIQSYISYRDGSPGYANQMRYAVNDLQRFAGRELHPWDLSKKLINEYLYDCRDRLAPATRRNRRGYFSALLEFAAEDEELSERPSRLGRLAQIKVPETIVTTWTIEQVQQLYSHAGSVRGSYGGHRLEGGLRSLEVPKAKYWQAWILASWDTAWRGCDLRSLERDWIPTHGRLVIQQNKTGKIVASQLRPETIAAIDALIAEHRSRLCFPLWCRLDAWRAAAAVLVRRAKLEGSIGWLRSAAATAAEVAHPGSGHLLTGHASRVTFLRHYCDQSQVSSVPLPPSLVPSA